MTSIEYRRAICVRIESVFRWLSPHDREFSAAGDGSRQTSSTTRGAPARADEGRTWPRRRSPTPRGCAPSSGVALAHATAGGLIGKATAKAAGRTRTRDRLTDCTWREYNEMRHSTWRAGEDWRDGIPECTVLLFPLLDPTDFHRVLFKVWRETVIYRLNGRTDE
jgi:hypothetical protein